MVAPATETARRVSEGELTASEAVDVALRRIDEVDEDINAYVTVTDETARDEAEERDGEDSDGPLAGVPVALKDLRAMKKGTRHTLGCKPFENFVAPRTAAYVDRLEDAGAVVVGKTNVPELGHKGVTNNQLVGSTATPFDTSRTSGGSSGGSAAAVAAGTVPLATGSDAGGSIRIPASACGVYGLKPSFGRVPEDGRPNAFGRETHHTVVGPITRTVEDAAVALDVMSGPHPRDPVALPSEDRDYADAVDEDVDGASVAYSPDLGMLPVEDEIASTVRDAVGAFEDAGAEVEEVDMNHGVEKEDIEEDAWTTFSVDLHGAVETLAHEYGIDLRDYEEDVSDSLIEVLEAGADRTTTDYALTGITRTKVFDAVQDIFADYDYLVTPTLAVEPFGRELDGVEEVAGEEVQKYGGWTFTPPFNWTDHPAASVPAGLTDAGLPVGMQIVGPRHGDYEVLAASAAFERVRPWEGIYEEIDV